MDIVGRARELAELDAHRRAVARGPGRCVALVGEPGAGKSRLLAELRARAAGWRVLSGYGTQYEADLPYAIFADALGEDLFAAVPAGFGAERHRLHRAVAVRLARAADPQPLLLVLDDVHWADRASLELIAHLARRPAARVLLVLAYRPAQLRVRLPEAARVTLAPLTRTDAEPFLAGVPGALRDAVYEASGGNPLFLEALARRDASAAIPGEIEAVLAEELEALPPMALRFARGAAVAGDPFAPELAAAAAGMGDEEGLAALDELLAAGLASTTEVPRRLRFRHPVVRQAVYASAGAGWRLGAHARVEAVLARQGATPVARAHHLEQCARPGEREAIEVLAAAAAATAPHAPAAAAHWWGAALRLLPQVAPDDERLALLVPRATALGAAGELAESAAALYDVLALLDEPALRGQVVAFIALVEQLLGRHDVARALLRETLAALPDQRSAAAVALRIELAKERYFSADWRGMRAYASEALAGARELEPPLRAVAAGIFALAEYHLGAIGNARVLLDEAAARLDALDDGQLAARLDAALFVGWSEQCLARWDDVHRHYERALGVARATGQGYLLVPMTIGRAIAYLWQGRLAASAELAEEAIDAARLSGNGQSLTWALTLRCWIATPAGELELARATGEEAQAIASHFEHSHWSALTGCFLAEAHLEAGDHAACRALLPACAGGPELPLIEPAFRTRWFEILTRAELAAGDFHAAARYAARAETTVRSLGARLPARESEALRARAAVRLAAGDADGATEAARAAARTAHAVGNRLDAARAHALAGSALTAAGREEEATVALLAAQDALATCGATRLADEAACQLRRLGRRVPRQGRRDVARAETGLGALTDREREVATLIAAGHTNRRIAAQLHLSPKTVETHVAHIFAKLGVRARAAVATMLARA